MKRLAIVSISVPMREKDKWIDIVSRHVPKSSVQWFEPIDPKSGSVNVQCRIDVANTKYESLLKLLKEHATQEEDVPVVAPAPGDPKFVERMEAHAEHVAKHVIWRIVRFEHYYSERELRSFPLLCLSINRREIPCCLPDYGTEFDLRPACPACYTGARQTSPLRIPRSLLPRHGTLAATCDLAVLVAKPLRDAIVEAGTTGLELREAVSHRTGEGLGWYQLLPQSCMPPFDPRTRGIVLGEGCEAPCARCGRDGHYNSSQEPTEFAYARRAVTAATLKEVMHTWECAGKSIKRQDLRQCRFAQPWILVRPNVYDLFKRLKVRHARFSPVRILD